MDCTSSTFAVSTEPLGDDHPLVVGMNYVSESLQYVEYLKPQERMDLAERCVELAVEAVRDYRRDPNGMAEWLISVVDDCEI